jgi:glycerophosphoryl diester phosphodiesterase
MKYLFVIFFLSFFACKSFDNKPLSGETDLQGHRGARGLKPENTWPAFEEAFNYKMTTLELDTVLTKDGHIVIHHDNETNPKICQKADGTPIEKKSLYELDLAYLKSLDCGAKQNLPRFPEQVIVPGTKILTINEFFDKVIEFEKKNPKSAVLFNIETKFPDDAHSKVSKDIVDKHVSKLLDAIQKAKMVERTTIQSFYLPALEVVQKKNQKIKRSALFEADEDQSPNSSYGDEWRANVLAESKRLKVQVISPYFPFVTDEMIYLAHQENMQVIPWTVNEEKDMKKLLNIGIDGIISDYPDRLRKVYNEWKSSKH